MTAGYNFPVSVLDPTMIHWNVLNYVYLHRSYTYTKPPSPRYDCMKAAQG